MQRPVFLDGSKTTEDDVEFSKDYEFKSKGAAEPFEMPESKSGPETLDEMISQAQIPPAHRLFMRAYKQPAGKNNYCGPASLASVMDYYGIDFPDLSKPGGRPLNDDFVYATARWSGTPDVLGGVLGTSGDHMRDTFKNKLNGFNAGWYTSVAEDYLMSQVKSEIANGRPCIILMDYGNYWMDWQVCTGYDPHGIFTNVTFVPQYEFTHMCNSEFISRAKNNIPGYTGSLIKIWKT
ncbi:C39 family peptidase [Robiginitomaculum antarcticum]|uniref:C39 family peptidase n=1 Tax=Robiginitomaculum antarcticum TaxID=437507 RepID=UPI00037F95CE|nr:C39 family peptidase [Robiginitomaculum antarcticum]